MMQTATTNTVNAKGKLMGLVLFALVVVTAVLIVATVIDDGVTSTANAATASAKATEVARCGMDEKTYTVQLPAAARYDIENRALCTSPAEVQP
jgi:galactitol-specific phosphotransferase system IIC component